MYVNTKHGKRSSGIRTQDGKVHASSLVIVAAGGGVGRLVPEIGKKVVAKSWSVAHVHLSDEETSALRGIPVTYARDLGFLFEPDPDTNLLKICPMGGGYVNTDEKGVSIAPRNLEESAFVPECDERQMRKLLAQTFPALAERPLVRKSLCWFADTDDSDFIIDYVPGTSGSVVILSGDSGHGFKMFPIFGSWVADLIQAGRQGEARWRWKESSPGEEKGNWGGNVSWRIGESRELAEIRPEIRPAVLSKL